MAAFHNWQDVLKSVKADPIETEQFYMIKVGEGKEEERSRFMNRSECIQFIQRQIGAY